MTICIAAICEKGSSLIYATDSMMTNEGLMIQFEHPTKKMTELSDKCIALTAGDALAHTELFDKVKNEITKLKAPSILEIVEKIKDSYQSIRKKEIMERILIPRGFNNFDDFYRKQSALVSDVALSIQSQIDRYDYGLDILVAGITDKSAHIYGIADPGTSKSFDAIGFHAIGSGMGHAVNSLIARDCHQGTTWEEALLIVYEAKKMAQKAPGVGCNITDICIMSPERIVEIQRDNIKELETIYEKWIRREPNWKSDVDMFIGEAKE